jgi:SEL1 protein
MNGPSHGQAPETTKEQLKLSQPLLKAVRLLEIAAKDNNSDAIHLLGEMNFHGNFSHPRNYPEAFRRYYDLATLTGNSTAQHMVGFMYATGIGGAVERDQAKALLYHTFAALGGETRSEMTVAFRHHSGIATPRNCTKAAYYYKRVADKAIRYWRAGPPGGRAISKHGYRLAENEGGVYGEGASASSSGVNANKGGPTSDSHAAFDDVLEYLDLMSRKGDLKATLSLGRLYYDGSRVLKRNLKKARNYFMTVAKQYWTRDGKVIAGDQGMEKLAGKAAGYLGRIYLRGDGVEQSFERALTWFKRGIANGDALSQNDMGLMYLHGYGVPKDALKAATYFETSADQDFAPAQVNLGALYLDQGDVPTAIRYFEQAVRHGNIEAYYYLAEISDQGIGRDRSCGIATAYYKIVAERVETTHSSFEAANEAYEDGDLEAALIGYMMAAEQGYEAGQANVAYLLDEQKSRFPLVSLDAILPFKQTRTPLLRNPELALLYWGRSAKQSNIDSMVKMGDYYLRGIGTEADPEKAASCYHAASEYQQSAQALWNLGWMHENGIGVEQDFHLAKRFYDLAYETNQEAYLPVTLGLLKLRMRSFWNTITNGRVNSIRSEPGMFFSGIAPRSRC